MTKELIEAIKKVNTFPRKVMSVDYEFEKEATDRFSSIGGVKQSSIYAPVPGKFYVIYKSNFVVTTTYNKDTYEIFRFENYFNFQLETKTIEKINDGGFLITLNFNGCVLKLIGYNK